MRVRLLKFETVVPIVSRRLGFVGDAAKKANDHSSFPTTGTWIGRCRCLTILSPLQSSYYRPSLLLQDYRLSTVRSLYTAFSRISTFLHRNTSSATSKSESLVQAYHSTNRQRGIHTMKTTFALTFLASMASTVVEVQGTLRGESRPKPSRALKDKSMKSKKEGKDEASGTEEIVATLDPTQCRDIPVEVRDDGSQTNFATLYAGIYAWGETSDLNTQMLCDSFVAAYTYLTDCSVIPGAYRTVADCIVVPDATGPNEDAFLLNMTYFANTVNGAQLFQFEDADPRCYCDRCPGLDPFPGIYRMDASGPICTCYCDIMSEDLSNTACTCRSPIISQVIQVMNVAFKDDDFYFLDARQLAVDSSCTGNGTTFDDTFICLGE